MTEHEGSASAAQGKVVVSLPKEVADIVDAISCNIDVAQEELATAVKARLGVAPPVRSMTRPQIVEIAVRALLEEQDRLAEAAGNAAGDDHEGES